MLASIMKLPVTTALALSTVLSAQEGFKPARVLSGDVPPLSVQAITGGQVLVEATVDPTGRISRLTGLRTTPPFGDLVIDAGPTPVGVESTVVDLTGKIPKILRPGAIPDQIRRELDSGGAG